MFMNLLAYEPKTAAAQAAEPLIGKISAAGEQWKALGTALTISFKAAYKEHEITLKQVEERFKTEDNNLMVYLFVAFVAGAAGGMGGMLVGPLIGGVAHAVAAGMASRVGRQFAQKSWVKVATEGVRRQERIMKTGSRVSEIGTKGVEEVGVKAVEKLEIDKFLAAANEPPVPNDQEFFKPATTDPHQFDLNQRHEVDLCVSQLKEYVKRFQIAADHFQWGRDAGKAFVELMIAEEFIQKQPVKKEIEDAAGIKKQMQAEVGMWIAWARTRKLDYWKTRLLAVRQIDRGADYLDYGELRRLDPIVERLKKLKVDHLPTMAFTVTDSAFKHLVRNREPLLNILALARLGSTSSDPFLQRAGTISGGKFNFKQWIKS